MDGNVQLLIRISSQSPYWRFASVVFNTIQSSAASIWQFVIQTFFVVLLANLYNELLCMRSIKKIIRAMKIRLYPIGIFNFVMLEIIPERDYNV